MTAKRFTRINGLEPKLLSVNPTVIAAIDPATGMEIAKCTGFNEKICLSKLLGKVYAHNKAIALARDGFACKVCSCVNRPLSHHHIKHRAQGRDDRVENLMTVCFVCHEQLHKSPKGRRAHAAVAEEEIPERQSIEAGDEAGSWNELSFLDGG